MTLRRATERLREVGSLPVLLIALLIAMSGDLSAQDRSRSRSSSSSDHGSRTAVPRADSGSSPSRPSYSPPRTGSSSSPSSPSSAPRSSSPSRGRYAVPGSPGEAHRQPPHNRHDSDWGHGHGHGGYYGGHYSYPSWYGYYGPGWWWAPYGYWGWWWWGDNYWPYSPYYYDHPYERHGYYQDGAGALDLDVSPGRTQVFLDGQYIGTVDQYDGFPTYLWLEKGTYDLVLYLDGYRTVAKQISVYPGAVIDVNDRLEPGPSVRPEDLVTKTHERRDARESFEKERRERIERGEDPYDEDGDWHDRVRRDREDRRDQGEEIEIQDDNGRSDHGEQGRVRLEVYPDDSSIYLDGQFVGTARDLASLRRGLLVDPGKHNVAAVRPGRMSVEKEFEVGPGAEIELELELDPMSP